MMLIRASILALLCVALIPGSVFAALDAAPGKVAQAPQAATKVAPPTAEEILTRMKAAPLRAKSLVAEMQIKDFLGADGKGFVVQGKFKGLPEKNLFEQTFVRSQMSNGQVWRQERQVCDGKFVWTIYEAGGMGAGAICKCSMDVFNQHRELKIAGAGAGGEHLAGGLIWTEDTPDGPLEVEAYDELFAFPEVTEETFEGVKVFRLQGRVRAELVAKIHQKFGKYGAKYEPGACCLYVGKDDFILRQSTLVDMNGNVAKLTHFSIQTDTSLDEQLFSYTPPAGKTAVDQTDMYRKLNK